MLGSGVLRRLGLADGSFSHSRRIAAGRAFRLLPIENNCAQLERAANNLLPCRSKRAAESLWARLTSGERARECARPASVRPARREEEEEEAKNEGELRWLDVSRREAIKETDERKTKRRV